MIGPKYKNDKKVSDDFYDRISYYEARNIFSSNEPVNPNNRLYTNYANNTHSVWESIKQPNYLIFIPLYTIPMIFIRIITGVIFHRGQ